MARSEQDREDLIGEATALVERIELRFEGVTVVVGFRANGAASVFIADDPVYQFDSQNSLRRAFVNGQIIKAETGRLVRLERQRSVAAVALVRSELNDREAAEFLTRFELLRQRMLANLAENQFAVVNQVPADRPVLARARQWLASLPAPIPVANSARLA